MNQSDKLINNVTLSAIVGQEKYFEKTLKAVIFSSQKILFKNIQILSCIDFQYDNIKCIKIPQLNYQEYNNFVIKRYNEYINTDFVLHVQDDGFVINPESWTDDFLEYDYIGALWPIDFHVNPPVTRETRCGNGGFTLRSKRFLEISQKYCPCNGFNEDALVCRMYRDIFLNNNIKYATDDIASKFSIEADNIPEAIGQSHKDKKTIKSFGFHFKESDAVSYLNEIIV